MRALLLISVLAFGCATTGPFVSKGPVISGVTQNEAWVAWETTARRGGSCGPATLQLAGPAGSASVQDASCGTVHHAHLTGLHPGTAYSFSLLHGDAERQPSAGRFATAPGQADTPFSFVVYGDNRDSSLFEPGTRPGHAAVAAAILKREPAAAFFVQTGDLALNVAGISGRDRGYAEFFDVERALLASRPIFAVVGNHEKFDLEEFDSLVNARSFAREEHPYYGSVDWARVHLVLLDSFDGPRGRGGFSPAQLSWLEADLAKARAAGKLIFIATHWGPYSYCHKSFHCHGGLPADAREKLVPLLVKYGVTAVFAGHDHYYERGQQGGLNYLVVGGGGAPLYEPDSAHPGVLAARKAFSYVVVSVSGRGATMVAKDTDGAIIDSAALSGPAEASP